MFYQTFIFLLCTSLLLYNYICPIPLILHFTCIYTFLYWYFFTFDFTFTFFPFRHLLSPCLVFFFFFSLFPNHFFQASIKKFYCVHQQCVWLVRTRKWFDWKKDFEIRTLCVIPWNLWVSCVVLCCVVLWCDVM